MALLIQFFSQLAVVWAFVANTWWLWVPPLLLSYGWWFWKLYLSNRYFANVQWVLLEVRIPRDIAKTPEAMEQIFAGLQTMLFNLDPWERYWLGLQHDYCIFEVASMGGETRFYTRVPVFFRNVAESHIYAQYPEAEIVEVEDYMNQLPEAIGGEYEIFGLEFKLAKPDAYPIKTYRDYINLVAGQEEYEKVDPFSAMMEVFSKIKPGEHLGYHILMRPAQKTNTWKEEGEAIIGKLVGRKTETKKSFLQEILGPLSEGWGDELRKILTISPGETVPKKKEEEKRISFLPPDTEEVVKAITKKITKPGWEVIVRACYIGRRDMFHMSHFSALIGSMRQYNTLTLNAFSLNTKAMATRVSWWLPTFATRNWKARKKKMFYNYYRGRVPFIGVPLLYSKMIVLNTEELATIYHYPTMTAKAPLMPRIEAKRSEPPAALPVG